MQDHAVLVRPCDSGSRASVLDGGPARLNVHIVFRHCVGQHVAAARRPHLAPVHVIVGSLLLGCVRVVFNRKSKENACRPDPSARSGHLILHDQA